VLRNKKNKLLEIWITKWKILKYDFMNI
jgi:hypothetical protein